MTQTLRVLAALAAMGAATPVLAVFGISPPALFISLNLLLAALGFVAPVHGLLIIAGLLPLSTMLTMLGHVPLAGSVASETFVLSFLVGWFAGVAWRGDTRLPARLRLPLLMLAAVVATSGLVAVVRAMPYDGGVLGNVAAETERFLDDFPLRKSPWHPWYTAIRWMAALGLFSACASAVAVAPDAYLRARGLMRMLAVGLAAAAALNVAAFGEAVLASADPAHATRDYLSWLRINIHYPDLNAAGSVLALSALVHLAFARTTGRLAWIPSIGLVVTLAALWLAGSRTAVAALVVTVVAGALLERNVRWTRPALALAGGMLCVAIAVAAFMIWQFPRERANMDPAQALGIRIELFNRSARMIREHPVFGIGVGTYYSESFRYATPGASFSHENAHNDVAQIFSELGIVGLAALLWLLYEALGTLVRNRGGIVPHRFGVWWLMGIIAYVLTGFAGHPLIVFDSAVPFWMVVGVAAGFARAATLPVERALALALAAVLLVTTPLRLSGARSVTIDQGPSFVWQTQDGTPFRDAGRADGVVLKGRIDAVRIPLRLRRQDAGVGEAVVAIAVDGEPVSRVPITTERWTTHDVMLPPGKIEARTLTLTLVTPGEGMGMLVGRVVIR
jgi:O-antigen ligase